MKQQNKQTILVVIIALVSLNFCCKKDLESETLVKPSNTLSERKIKDYKDNKRYINSRLDKTAKIIASLSRYKQFRKVVNEQVAKKFDGDYNVLLKDLIQAFPKEPYHKESSGSLTSSISIQTQSIVYDEQFPEDDPGEPINNYLEILRQDVETPYIVNEETIYPQIYIPFFGDEVIEYDPCSSNPSTGSTTTYTYPVVVPYDGDETTGIDVFNGYTYDTNGLEVPCGNVSECFAKRHTVWAITFNENVSQSGGIPNTTNSSTTSTSPVGSDVYMPTMTIKSHKESWIKGASEIYMVYAFSWDNKINPTTGLEQITHFNEPLNGAGLYNAYSTYITNFGSLNGGEFIKIRSFSRNEIKKDKQMPIDFTYAPLSRPKYSPGNNYYYPNSGNYLYFIIYEEDHEFYDTSPKTLYADGVAFNYIASNDEPYLATKIIIAPKNQPIYTQQSTNAANISNSVMDFVSRHK